MPRLFVILCLCAFSALAGGCASLGIDNPFSSGGSRQSQLLGVTLPAGMTLSPDHSRVSGGDGVEVAFGQVESAVVAQNLFNSLQGAGWQMRLQQTRPGKGVYVYESGERLAVVHVESQTVQTVVTICAGNRLPDGSMLNLPVASGGADDGTAGDGGEFGAGDLNSAPGSGGTPPVGTSESWGAPASSGGLQERSL